MKALDGRASISDAISQDCEVKEYRPKKEGENNSHINDSCIP